MAGNIAAPILLITTLAEYQTAFWLAIGHELEQKGHAVAFISFDDRSTEMLRMAGFETFAATAEELRPRTDDVTFHAVLAKYRIHDLNYWFTHERITFGIRNSNELRRKLIAYLALADRACTSLLASGHSVTMVQELGGFISVIASFFAARRHSIDNWFIEPAFFRGRMLFLRNSFTACRIEGETSMDVSPQVQEYLKNTLANRTIVVPKKDRHQYTTAFRKIVNVRNAKRLLTKLVDKYIHRKHQEFGYIGRYVYIHGRMLLNSLRLRGSYTTLGTIGRFVYYPLHVPADMALTLRSPEYLDQLALIAYIARTVPHTHKVVIKEHPAMIGAMNAGKLLELLACYDNVMLLPPSVNNYDVLSSADAIISVNSKSGAEAALLGKPVFVLGDAFYRHSPLVKAVDSITDLPRLLNNALEQVGRAFEQADDIERYFESVWCSSFPGELYVTQPNNVPVFAASMVAAVMAEQKSSFMNGTALQKESQHAAT